jgi:hypothetical protein
MTDPTTEELLNEIRRLERELDKTPTSIDMNESGEYWAKNYQDHFGGWNNALREVGLEPNQPKKIPTDDLLNELHRLAKKLNRVPTKKQMNDMGEYYGKSYQDRFGSWSEAVRQAGFEPNQRIPEAEFQEEPDACSLCDSSSTERLDFHHWRYGDNKAGCYFCRDCHDRVHAGGARPQEDTDWLIRAVENLIQSHVEQQKDASVAAIANRYNIPSEGLVECVIADIEV